MPEHQVLSLKSHLGLKPRCKETMQQDEQIDHLLGALSDSDQITKLDWVSDRDRMARQVTEAFPWDDAPTYLIRDRDRVYGAVFRRRLQAMGIRDHPIAPRSPWQNPYAERLIGTIRRECLDHVVVIGAAHLRRILQSYAAYYNQDRTHRSLNKDCPIHRPIQALGTIVSSPILGGLHLRYVRT